MLSWLRRTKKATPGHRAHAQAAASTQLKHAVHTGVSHGTELEAARRFALSQQWMARVQESLHLHVLLRFPTLDLSNYERGALDARVKSVLRPIRPLGLSKEYPKGDWEKQKLVLHFKDTWPAIEGYRPIVSQLMVGLALDGSIGSEVMAFVYENDPLTTPRLARRHQLRLVKDLTAIGVILNQQLESVGFQLTHISLERRSCDRNRVQTGNCVLRIDSNEVIKYTVDIPGGESPPSLKYRSTHDRPIGTPFGPGLEEPGISPGIHGSEYHAGGRLANPHQPGSARVVASGAG